MPEEVEERRVHQVIVNLITNAHHAMHASTSDRRLSIRTRFRAMDVRVSVADTGSGIPPEVLVRIFEPFFTTKPVGQGTGLGLPLCQGIVEGHGGILRVESKVGEGTVMIIDLPVIAPPEGDAKAMEAEVSLPQGIRILIVDDESHVAGVLTDLLEAQGAQVEVASGGRDSLEWLGRAECDIILSDVRMPGLDGPGLYKALGGAHPQLLSRFVFLTGDTLNPESSEFVRQTGAPCINKPFDFE
jgi:CheY-like chemotaxis protein/anti-sigma regulatory factor (Ser/Thr protein kinase)